MCVCHDESRYHDICVRCRGDVVTVHIVDAKYVEYGLNNKNEWWNETNVEKDSYEWQIDINRMTKTKNRTKGNKKTGTHLIPTYFMFITCSVQ